MGRRGWNACTASSRLERTKANEVVVHAQKKRERLRATSVAWCMKASNGSSATNTKKAWDEPPVATSHSTGTAMTASRPSKPRWTAPL